MYLSDEDYTTDIDDKKVEKIIEKITSKLKELTRKA